MQLLSVESVGKQYDDRLLFENVTFGVEQGARLGVIGVNGSGKSTLLRIVAGVETPDRGQITFRSGTRVAYLAQQPVMDDRATIREYMFSGESERIGLLSAYELAVDRLHADPHDPTAMEQMSEISARMDAAGAWDAENDVRTILSRLGITDLAQRLAALSGGQRRRVALARALIDPADLLILDEPTNHLDADTVAWLETMLARTPAALLLVTHDRYFLDRIVQRTLELDRGALYQYDGGYSSYLEQKVERAAQQANDDARRTSILRRELAWLRRGPQGRGTKQKARIERIGAMQATSDAEPERELAITLGTQRLGNRVLELEHVTKGYGDRTLIEDLTLSIGKGERLGIVGPNGAGKSTLLNMIAGRDQPDRGGIVRGETVHIAYYDQESKDLDPTQRVIDYLKSEAELIRTSDGEIITAADMLERFLFPARLQYAMIGTLSGGERRRLYLLRTLMFAPNVLLLDEPSNDLDIQTLTILEDYLDGFGGTLVIASHDRYLLDRTVDHLLVFAGDGGVRTFPGSYSAYATDRRQQADPPPSTPKRSTRTAPPAPTVAKERPRTLSFKEKRELSALENRIAELEAAQHDLNAQLSSGALPYAELQRVSESLVAVGVELEQAFERWAELAAIAEGAA